MLILFLAFSLTWFRVEAPSFPSTSLRVYFLDVGQGDSTLIMFPSGASMLIDGGERAEGAKVADFLSSMGLTSLDVVVATHPHADHIGGLVTVLELFKVGLVIDSGQITSTKTFEDYLNIIDKKNIAFKIGGEGDSLELDPSVRVSILSPPSSLYTGTGFDLDANSLVIKMVYGQVSFLFTGDVGSEVESHLTRFNIDVDVLKVAHHGSVAGTSRRFLQATTPLVALISVGAENPYGHPDQETLSRLASAGAAVYRTDRHGTVTVSTDGDSFLVSTEKMAPAQAYTKWRGKTFKVTLDTNSTVMDYQFQQSSKRISLKIYGQTGTMGFLTISLPIALLGPPYTLRFDGNPIQAEVHQTCRHASIKIKYTHSQHTLTITGATAIPDLIYPPIAFTAAILAFLYVFKKRGKKWGRR
ncbi:MAG: ComEC/Rec2 family competence protein [Candidatus Bathyarchaeia archaeon]